jgi:hypothetical protein
VAAAREDAAPNTTCYRRPTGGSDENVVLIEEPEVSLLSIILEALPSTVGALDHGHELVAAVIKVNAPQHVDLDAGTVTNQPEELLGLGRIRIGRAGFRPRRRRTRF